MSPSNNTLSGSIDNITISTEATTTSTSNSYYLIQTVFSAIIKELKESLKETIPKLSLVSLHIKEYFNKFSSKLIVNEVLTLTYETPYSIDKFERKFQDKLSPYNNIFEYQNNN